jgi:hypothetical protein
MKADLESTMNDSGWSHVSFTVLQAAIRVEDGRREDERVTLDAMVLAELGLDGAVDLGELDVLLLEGGGGLLVVWSEAGRETRRKDRM